MARIHPVSGRKMVAAGCLETLCYLFTKLLVFNSRISYAVRTSDVKIKGPCIRLIAGKSMFSFHPFIKFLFNLTSR